MSITRLQQALAGIELVVLGNPELEAWRFGPIDPDLVDEIADSVAPLRFADEHLWMARNGGYLPGFRPWSHWEGIEVPAGMSLPVPDGDTAWFQYGNEELSTRMAIVPITSAAHDVSPIAFTDEWFFLDIRFPSLAVMLESFTFYLNELQSIEPELYEPKIVAGMGFSDTWLTDAIEAMDADDATDPLTRALSRTGSHVTALLEAWTDTHPAWPQDPAMRIRDPQAADFADGWIPLKF